MKTAGKYHKAAAALAALLLALCLCLAGCGAPKTVSSIELGSGIPEWELAAPREVLLPADAAEPELSAVYPDKDGLEDLWVYSYPREEGVTLADIGQQHAGAQGVFCNMMQYKDCGIANYFYYDAERQELVQNYIFEGEDSFVKVASHYTTVQLPLGETGLTFRLPALYSVQDAADSPFPLGYAYTAESDDLPLVTVTQMPNDFLTADSYDPALFTGTGPEQFASYAAGGWTPEECIALYDDGFDLLKGEMILRSGREAAFIGYVDEGIFKVRAIMAVDGALVTIGAQDQASNFRHMVNALIDTIR